MKKAIRIFIGLVVVLLIGAFMISSSLFSMLLQKFYWFELVLLVLVVWGYGISYSFVLKSALAITFLGGILNIFVYDQLAEITLRIGLVFWVVGLVRVLETYRKNAKN